MLPTVWNADLRNRIETDSARRLLPSITRTYITVALGGVLCPEVVVDTLDDGPIGLRVILNCTTLIGLL